jgi:pimeloyl-ACP methyl ester carboxylesterase
MMKRSEIDSGTPVRADGSRPVHPLIDLSDTAARYQLIHGHLRAYRTVGSGPAVLLIHGIGDSSQAWRPLMPALAPYYKVIAPDLLGHGESAKPRADYSVGAYANGMRDLLDVLGIERATIVGHSLGGGVAAQFAYQYPERCERLVLVSSGGIGREVSPFLRMAAAPLAELALPPMQWPLPRLAGLLMLEFLKWAGTDLGRDADDLLRAFDALPDGPARGAFKRTLRSVVDWRGQVVTMLDRCYLAEGMPLLLVWGGHDGIIPTSHAYQAHSAMPGSRLVLFETAGHYPHHTDPARFVAELKDFIDTTEPAHHQREQWRDRLRKGRPVTASPAEMGPSTPAATDHAAAR